MTGIGDRSYPSIDRESVSRPAARAAGAIAGACDLSAYRLAGGTALAWFLGHRRSDDLDFFTRIPGHLNDAEQARLAGRLREVDPAATIQTAEETVHARLLGCEVSFFGQPGTWLEAPTLVAEGLALATVDEIAAMKLVAVSTRSAKKDFFDLHALASRGYTAAQMFGALQRMYSHAVDADVGRHIVLALTDFSDAELDPDPIVLDGTTWAAAMRTAVRLAEDLRRYVDARLST